MKKVFISLMFAFFATSMFAQSPFVVSPSQLQGQPSQLLGECMSQNRNYVVGTDLEPNAPMVWNTITNQVFEIIEFDSAMMEYDDGSSVMEYSYKTGTFHGVNNAGIAVGSLTGADYVSRPIMANVNENGAYSVLYFQEEDAGCEAYAISENGVIAGFYFDEDWTTYACIWTDNGTVRTDLPVPTEAQLGFPVDYASARWISSDANTILGYAQDANNGAWVACAWVKENGEYVVRTFSNNYFQTNYYDDNGNFVQPGRNPYFEFSPAALSANGEWVALTVVSAYDPSDWDADATPRAARLNLNTNVFEVLELGFEHESNEVFGIANNGTCVGRLTGIMDFTNWQQDIYGMIWKAGDTTCANVADVYPDDAYAANISSSALSFITADAAYVMGYTSSFNEEWTSFYMAMPEAEPLSIDQVDATVALYPNPASAYVNVTINSEIRSYSVVNAMGQVVMNQNGVNANNITINTQSLPAGVYFVNVITDKGQVAKRISVVK